MAARDLKKAFIGLLALHLVGIVALVMLARYEVARQRPVAEADRMFRIPDGSSVNQVLRRLRDLKLAPNPTLVKLALFLDGRNPVLRKGTYLLPELSSTLDILKLFEEGRVFAHKVTVPEGFDRWQIVELLAATKLGTAAQFDELISDPAPIRHLDPDATSLEGYLYPETYFFPPDMTPAEAVGTMVQEWERRTADLRQRLTGQQRSLNQWVTLASLVEKESSIASERPTIAGVFENRIRNNMRLQCDPTIIYSLKLAKNYRGKIFKSDIMFDHPYNTYRYKGLPPGPIASPSYDALAAALEPEPTPYLYFVAKGDGSHHFSGTLNEHNRAVYRFLRN